MKTKSVKYTVTFKAAPKQVYELLMDWRRHTSFTEYIARIKKKVGSSFTLYGRYIKGKNLELKPNKKIVWAWRETRWPKGHFSKATFVFSKAKTGTRMSFTQVGIPIKFYKQIKKGWVDYYWKPMKRALAKR